MTPLVEQQDQFDDAVVPMVDDPRSHPAFDEAYSSVCEQTVIGLDRGHTSAGPDLMVTIGADHLALTQRLAVVYGRKDLWAAADPLVLEFADNVAADLQ